MLCKGYPLYRLTQVPDVSGLSRIAHARSRPRCARPIWRTPCRDRMRLVRAHPFIPSYDIHHLTYGGPSNEHITEIFRLPYELFVDASPGQALYRTLRMGQVSSGARKAHRVGSYVRHGAVSGLAMVVAHALRVGMPVWERGGDASQLGGEFVLGPGYAHLAFPYSFTS